MRCTVAVPGVRLADGAAALHTDRGHSLRSLHPPLAALPSLPRNDNILLFRACVSRLEDLQKPFPTCGSFLAVMTETQLPRTIPPAGICQPLHIVPRAVIHTAERPQCQTSVILRNEVTKNLHRPTVRISKGILHCVQNDRKEERNDKDCPLSIVHWCVWHSAELYAEDFPGAMSQVNPLLSF